MIFDFIQAQAVKLLGGALLVAIAAVPINGCVQYREGRAEGREAVLSELRAAQAKKAQEALEAASTANTRAAERADESAAVLAEQIKQIEKAEVNDENPLDVLLGS